MHNLCPKCGKAWAPTPNINAAVAECVNGHVITHIELMKLNPASQDDKAVQRAGAMIRGSRL